MNVTDFLISQVPFLKGLNEDQAAYLTDKVEQQSYNKGQTIVFKGTTVDGLSIVAKGKATVHIKPEKDKPWKNIAELKTGDVFGETSIIEFKMAGAMIKCAEDNTLVLIIPEQQFLKLLNTDEGLKSRMVELIKQRQAARHPDKKNKNPNEVEKLIDEKGNVKDPAAPAEQPAAQPQAAAQPAPVQPQIVAQPQTPAQPQPQAAPQQQPPPGQPPQK